MDLVSTAIQEFVQISSSKCFKSFAQDSMNTINVIKILANKFLLLQRRFSETVFIQALY